MKKVLIGIDKSESAFNAAKYGINYAVANNLEIGIVEVSNYAIGNIDAGVLPEEADKTNQSQSKANVGRLKALFPNVVMKEFEPIGKPVDEIKKIIEGWGADMLIIGHQTHGLLHKVFSTNIEEQLVNHINIPLLIVPENNNSKG